MHAAKCCRSIAALIAAISVSVLSLQAGAPAVFSGRSAHPSFPAVAAEGVSVQGRVLTADNAAQVTVLVELTDAPAAVVYEEAAASAVIANPYAVAADHVAFIKTKQNALLPALTGAGIKGKTIYTMQRAVNGVVMLVGADKLDALRSLPGVKAVRRLIPQAPSAFTSADFLGVPGLWTRPGLGLTGAGVKVGIIDSGIDYTHANFGGRGYDAYWNEDGIGPVDGNPDPNPDFPSLKVVGGYDFAGDGYNAAGTEAQQIPVPDPDPLDCGGHGTGVASIIGGYGVNADGSTFMGPYDGSVPFGALSIGPGFAPEAKLYALRVFGCSGSTNLVGQAIEWAMDPNGDGDMTDHLDVINMSLGYVNAVGEIDSDIALADNATKVGVVVVCSAGNESDAFFNTGGPSVAGGAIGTAATLNDDFTFPRVLVNTPADLPLGQTYWATTSSFAPGAPNPGLTGDVVVANPLFANTPLINAAEVAGKIVLIQRGSVSFVQKAQAAFDAGAIGVLMFNNAANGAPIAMGGVGNIAIPVVMIGTNEGLGIQTAIAGGQTVNVTLDGSLAGSDLVADYSSRGPRTGDGLLKPDLAAPAEAVDVAAVSTGTGKTGFNGTSSAAPHVAGVVTLMKQLHPTWTVEELKALVMNTATHNVGLSVTSPTVELGVGRAGAGRIDPIKAEQSKVVAYSLDRRGWVSATYGIIDATPGMAPLYQTIMLRNKGDTNVTFDVSFETMTDLLDPDAAKVTFPLGTRVTVGRAPLVNVLVASLQIDYTKLLNWYDQSIGLTQAVSGWYTPEASRHWLPELSGYIVLTPTAGTQPTLRVPVHAIIRPAANAWVNAAALDFAGADGSVALPVTGQTLGDALSLAPFEYISMAKAYELQEASPISPDVAMYNDPASDEYDPALYQFMLGFDIQAVGVSSDYSTTVVGGIGAIADTWLSFGVATYGDRSVIAQSNFAIQIAIDTNGDEVEDYYVLADRLSTAAPDPTNVYVSRVFDVAQQKYYLVDYINLDPNLVHTNLLQSNVMMLPAPASLIGLTDGTSRFNYAVLTVLYGDLIDATEWLTYDPATPGLDTAMGSWEPFMFTATAGDTIPVTYNTANFMANKSVGLLVTHLHNAPGQRVQTIMAAVPMPVISGFSTLSGPEGTVVTIQGQNLSQVKKVLFSPDRPASFRVVSDTEIEATVPRRARTGAISLESAYGNASSGRLKFKVVR